MALILQYLNSIASYINWVIAFHFKEYLFFAIIFILIGILLLIIVRSKIMYIFPIVFFVIAGMLMIMAAAGAGDFGWDYLLVLAFANLAPGYILFVLISMVLSRPQI
jgi:hypothetical protein